MSKDRDDGFDATRPTLIVKYGGATRQYRTLDREVLIVGRSAGCDVGLEAPDVAPVHCVLARAGRLAHPRLHRPRLHAPQRPIRAGRRADR